MFIISIFLVKDSAIIFDNTKQGENKKNPVRANVLDFFIRKFPFDVPIQ
jgi:hypothetical protein